MDYIRHQESNIFSAPVNVLHIIKHAMKVRILTLMSSPIMWHPRIPQNKPEMATEQKIWMCGCIQ